MSNQPQQGMPYPGKQANQPQPQPIQGKPPVAQQQPYQNRPDLTSEQQQIQSQKQTYQSQAEANATAQALREVPANAQNVQVQREPMVGPLQPGQTRPSNVVISYNIPQKQDVKSQPPESASQRMLNYGDKMPTLNLSNRVVGGITGRPGMGLSIPGQRSNPLAAPAGVVAAGESIVYSAPRGLTSMASYVVGQAGFVTAPIEYALGGSKAVGSTKAMFDVAAPQVVNRVVPAPPPTVSSEIAASIVQGKPTEGLGFVARNPAYAIGSLLPEMVMAGQLADSAPAIKAGIKQTANVVTEKVISKTTTYESAQDYLDWNYRVRAELTPAGEALPPPSIGERLVMRTTGLRGREPVTGIMSMPTVETVPKEGWETYRTVEPANRVASRATGLSGQASEERILASAIREKEPLDSVNNMVRGTGAKYQAGMDAFDFESAPNTMNYGLSQPRPNPELTGRTPVAVQPQVKVANLGGGVLIEIPQNVPTSNMFPEEVKGRKMPESLLEKEYTPPTQSEPLAFDNRPWRVGVNKEYAFVKERLPTTEDLVPIEPAIQTGKGGMKNIFTEPTKVRSSTPVTEVSYGESGYSVGLVKEQISGLKFNQPMPRTSFVAQAEEEQSFSYPAFSIERGMVLNVKPIVTARQGQNQNQLLNQIVIPSLALGIKQPVAQRQALSPLQDQSLIFIQEQRQPQPQIQETTPEQKPVPTPKTDYLALSNNALSFEFPNAGFQFNMGGFDLQRYRRRTGFGSTRRTYPILTGFELI
jgi:hypothetical protein